MVDLSERENGVWGRERGDRANTEDKCHPTETSFTNVQSNLPNLTLKQYIDYPNHKTEEDSGLTATGTVRCIPFMKIKYLK